MAAAKPVDQFEYARRQLKSQASAESSRSREALKRQFARQGGLQSGAFIKVGQQAEQAINEQTGQALGGIEAAQIQDEGRKREIEAQRQFQTSERVGAQQFAQGQAAEQRGFITSERTGGQDFASKQNIGQQQFVSNESEKQRGFTGSESQKARDQAADFFKTDAGLRQQTIDLQKIIEFGDASQGLEGEARLRQNQYYLDRETTYFNKMIAAMGLEDKGTMENILANLSNDPNTPPSIASALAQFIDPVLNKGGEVGGQTYNDINPEKGESSIHAEQAKKWQETLDRKYREQGGASNPYNLQLNAQGMTREEWLDYVNGGAPRGAW